MHDDPLEASRQFLRDIAHGHQASYQVQQMRGNAAVIN